MNDDHDKTTGISIMNLSIDSPEPGQTISFPQMQATTLTCTGNAAGPIEATAVHATVYLLGDISEIPTSHPSGPNVSVTTPGPGGDWSVDVLANPGSPAVFNLLAVWFEYNAQMPDSLYTVVFNAEFTQNDSP